MIQGTFLVNKQYASPRLEKQERRTRSSKLLGLFSLRSKVSEFKVMAIRARRNISRRNEILSGYEDQYDFDLAPTTQLRWFQDEITGFPSRSSHALF